MSSLANTRKFSGSSIKVDDLDDGWITHSGPISVSFTGNDATIISITKANSTISDESDVILQDPGVCTLTFFDDMSDSFFIAMKTMKSGQQIREFKFTQLEGTKLVGTFNAYVSNRPVSASLKDKYKNTLTLRVVGAVVWAAT